ncbi:MAG TPA: general secretion pathway protein GspB [Steroidobacteraceae bacterium]|nr:general secretion pathway protein GspB [Steroidobacteraceae bacterium]
MSFILDALKKSEIERQRQSQPGFMDSPTAQRRSRLPLWAMLLGALLAINIVVLAVMLLRSGAPPPASPPKRHTEPAPLAEDKAPAADHFSPMGPAPVYAPEIPVTAADDVSSGTAAASQVAPLVAPPAASLSAPRSSAQRSAPRAALHRPDPVLIDEDAKADNEETLPSINQINLTGAQALPELHLDVHVYATKAGDRFVYINMRKYHEGSSLPEGPVVEHIRRDGVVLNYQGLRFILPRQS